MKSPTQAVSGTNVDLKDGHAAPGRLSRFTFHDNLINNTCSDHSYTGGHGNDITGVRRSVRMKHTK